MDAFGEIGVFVRVVEKRSFTRAGDLMGLTASGVSRVISRLEARLGVRLLERTTRSLGLTSDGAAYYERCTRILRELEAADGAIAQSRGVVRGRLRVDAPAVLGRFVIAPAIATFLDDYPDLSVDLSIRDHLIDPIAEGIDVVLRMAELRESELVHKKLGAMHFVLVASPRYLARHGRPTSPADLRKHRTLGFLTGATSLPWRFHTPGGDVTFSPNGRLHTNSVDALIGAAVQGHGLAYILAIRAKDEIERGDLEVVMQAHEPLELRIHALYTRENAALPKVRAFLDFMESCLGKKKPPAKQRKRLADKRR
ncbi:MAG TPA: LysR family transcriptional regulator [Polyangiaceae bacterium]|jgi:DNA-binding transcriptional LysR family regulator|nr:LysR family transcriptional regulator [Polyangiaceae bacterium]